MTRLRFILAALIGVVAAAATARDAASAPERHATLPAVSPDGKHVAYSRPLEGGSCELRVVGLDGQDDRLVRTLEQNDCVPAWSRRDSRILYGQTRGDSSLLWSVGLDGKPPRRVASFVARGTMALSNDGRRVVYAVGSWTRSRLMLADVAGRHPRALTDSTAGWFNFAWSPRDRMIASTRLDSTGALQVWLVDLASGATRALTAFPKDAGRPQWPSWSPDGKRVAVQSGRYDRDEPDKSEADIWLIDVATGRPQRVTERTRPWLDETPSWAPDNRHLVVQSSRTGRLELWRLSDDGKDAFQLTK
jgi:TolB protein